MVKGKKHLAPLWPVCRMVLLETAARRCVEMGGEARWKVGGMGAEAGSVSSISVYAATSGPIRDTPPRIVQYLSEIISQRGSRAVFPSFSCGIAEVSLRISDATSDGGASQLNLDHSIMDHQGRRKGLGMGRYCAALCILKHQNPIARNKGVSLT